MKAWLWMTIFLAAPYQAVAFQASKLGNASDEPLAKGVFLVASKKLYDSNFSKTVVLIARHGKQGAWGLIINRPIDVPLAEVFPNRKPFKRSSDTLFLGGPVSRNQIIILFKSDKAVEGADNIFDNVYASSSHQALEQILTDAPSDLVLRLYSGFAGWAPGQLEAEILRGDWRIAKGNANAIFEKDPDLVWDEFIKSVNQLWVMRRD